MGMPKIHSISDAWSIAKTSSALPILALLLAATLWGVFWYPLRWLQGTGLSGLGATLFIYIGANLHLLYFMRGRRTEVQRHALPLLLLAISTGWCNIAFIFAMLDGNVVRVLLLFYLSPIWTSLLAIILLGERLDRFSILILLIASVGAVVMLWQPALGVPWPQDGADWFALSSGFSFAVANIISRKFHAVSVQSKTAATWLGVTTLAVIGLLFGQSGVGDVSLTAILVALIFGFIIMYAMTMSVQFGVSNMPAHRSAIILLFELVAGALSALWLANESVRLQDWLGGGLVVLAAMGTARRQVHD